MVGADIEIQFKRTISYFDYMLHLNYLNDKGAKTNRESKDNDKFA